MKHEQEAMTAELVELGSVTADTQGDGAVVWEATGLRPQAGISHD